MASAWVTLPSTWDRAEVQAGISVLISVLTTLGMAGFLQLFWQSSVSQIKRRERVFLPTLVNISTVSDVLDVSFLFRRSLFSSRHANILGQCAVVVALTLVSLLGGPIAKVSTRIHDVVYPANLTGTLAVRGLGGVEYANVDINMTMARLNSAGFPYDQLLDYLPDLNHNWTYIPDEWNSSWSMQCKQTPKTVLKAYATNDCTSFWTNVPAFETAFPNPPDSWRVSSVGNNLANADSTLSFDIRTAFGLYFPDPDAPVSPYTNVSIASIIFENAIEAPQNSSCYFEPGPIGSLTFTRVDCHLAVVRPIPDHKYGAYPDNGQPEDVPESYQAYYFADWVKLWYSGEPLEPVPPSELIRFYQAYTITKDAISGQAVHRVFSTSFSRVQLSIPFLVVGLFFLCCAVAAIVRSSMFWWRRRELMGAAPKSKLDWMIHAMILNHDMQSSSTIELDRRQAATGLSTHLNEKLDIQNHRADFESARFAHHGHGHADEVIPARNPFETNMSISTSRCSTAEGLDPCDFQKEPRVVETANAV
ncbi:uncharacterized protein PV07_02023 [Cladophialophora immunda]|uniref:Uncharacterized protein n=1 Tax=Cladophialophora immunda TaxID=569365 RepID=A0A0D2A4Q3_9EURO|nr:uncharacterized protein PV07_02023 [Cladophialophora immunda]KIW35321.1 hypothetical protein PV07_02023 [Cladophialophora immunda]OQV11054.1 hypothetical protein CLAIMM_14958 [Cladophialophora immunda]